MWIAFTIIYALNACIRDLKFTPVRAHSYRQAEQKELFNLNMQMNFIHAMSPISRWLVKKAGYRGGMLSFR